MSEPDDGSLLIQLCKLLGYTVLFNTIVDKIPQLYNIITSGSTAGIALFSVVAELTAYTGMMTYQLAMEYPFHTFMENVMMVGNDWILLCTILYYRDMLRPFLIPYIIVYLAVFISVGMYWLPDALILSVMYSTTPILCWSKVRQLVQILLDRDPGQLSSITWLLVCYDTGVRMFTTAVITKDIPMFVNLTSSEVLNLSILFSILYYNAVKRRRRRRGSSRD